MTTKVKDDEILEGLPNPAALSKRDRIKAAQTLRRLLKENQVDGIENVPPEALFNEAKKKSSPFHSQFEWDKDQALEKYGLHTARNILKAVSFVRLDTESVFKKKMRERLTNVVLTRNEDGAPSTRGYVTETAVQTNTDIALESSKQALATIRGYLERIKRDNIEGRFTGWKKIIVAVDRFNDHE